MWLRLGRVVVRVESMLWGASSSSRWRVVEVKGLNSPPPLLLLENERAVASLSFPIHASDANFSNLRARGRRYTHVGYVRGVCSWGLCLVADTSTADEAPSRIKARRAALSAFAESQGLTGQAVFDGLRRLCSDLQTELLDTHQFTLFYCFVFFMCRERGQKSISVSTAIDAWRLSLTGRFRLLDEWCAFVQVHQRHAISEDTWRQVLEFSRSVHEDLSNYDPEGAWPVLVDDFVDNMYRKFACSRCSTGTDNLCDCGLGTILDVSPNAPSVAGSVPSRITPLPGVAASAGSKRRRKDLKDEAAQAESINCIAQRLAEMPSPLSSKRICRMATVAEITDPMEEIDADVPEVTDLWEQFDQTGVTDEVMQTSGCTQGLREHTITGGYDLLLSTTWQPWPSLGRLENCHLGHASLMPGNSFQTDAPTACGSYPLLLSAKQNVLLHQ